VQRRHLALAVLALAACRRPEAIRRDDSKKLSESTPPCALPADGRVSKALKLAAGCHSTVEGLGIVVVAGGTLEIEPGVELAFGPEGSLAVRGGVLLAKGSAQAPITLRASSKRWMGVRIETGKGSRLERVDVADVGLEARGAAMPKAAITLEPEAEQVTLANVRVRRCETSALSARKSAAAPVHAQSALAGAEGLEFDRSETPDTPSIVISAMGLGAVTSAKVGAKVTLDDPLVEGSIAWPKLDAPIVAPMGLMITGGVRGAPAELRVAEGTTLLLGPGSYVYVGYGGAPGALVAKGVRFDSAEPKPAAGDWRGFQFGHDSSSTQLLDCTIAHAAGGAAPTGAAPRGILQLGMVGVPKLERTKFVDDTGWAITSFDGCATLVSKAAANDFGKLSPCYDVKAEIAAKLRGELDSLELKLLGSLAGPVGATDGVLSKASSPGLDDVVAGPGATLGRGGGGGGDLRAGGGTKLPSPTPPPSTTP
jgi:hypothetical protein